MSVILRILEEKNFAADLPVGTRNIFPPLCSAYLCSFNTEYLSSLNNRQRKIESLRSFSTVFKLIHYYSIKVMYQIQETGDRWNIHKKFLTPKKKDKSINLEVVGVRYAKKRGSI